MTFPANARPPVVVFLVFIGDHREVEIERGDQLSTGQAARLLGVSRQHIVDLCDRGALRCVRIGTHRRVPRIDIEALLEPRLTRDQERSLWLHSAVAGRLVVEPEATMERVERNLQQLERKHPSGMASAWIGRWRSIFDRGTDAILEMLTSRTPTTVELRQNSPFAGVLSPQDRARTLDAFRLHWSREHRG
jgi:excisionase family DNA binding protein